MKVYANTDVGCTRQLNEDDFCVLQNQKDDLLAIVCDGIGGAAAGEVASALADLYLSRRILKVDSFYFRWRCEYMDSEYVRSCQ